MQLDFFSTSTETPEPAVDNRTLYCSKCDQDLPLEAFYQSTIDYAFRDKSKFNYKTSTGTASWCKCCKTKYTKQLKRLTEENKHHRPTEDYPCDCCGVITKPSSLSLDHDHITEMFRGWLCRRCNTGIGNLGDNVEGLQRAIDYLERVS